MLELVNNHFDKMYFFHGGACNGCLFLVKNALQQNLERNPPFAEGVEGVEGGRELGFLLN